MTGGVGERPHRLDRLFDHRMQVHWTLAQLEAVVGDPIEVEEVVHETHQLLQLPLHRRQGHRANVGVALGALEHFEHVAERGQRIAQFVRQRRQEFVLLAVGGRQVGGQRPQIVLELAPLGHVLAHGGKRHRRRQPRPSG